VSIGKSNGQTEVAPGSMVTYVITLTNDGPSNANGLVYDDFPSLLSNAQWMSASLDGGQVISDLAGITTLPGVQVDLPAGSALTITVYGDLSLTATGWLTNTAQFEIGLETPDEGNGECAANCGFMLKEVFPPENEPNPIINTNSITKAIDVDQILQSRVVLGAWNDLDGNGYLNFGEPMLPGVRIVITGNTLSAVEVVLDANGLFTQPVPPGPYTSTLAPGGAPPGFVQTSFPVVWNGSVAAGGMVTWYVGLQGRGSVAGIAFNDVDGNLDQGVSEPGLSGVVVTITGAAGEVQPSRAQTAIVMTTTTDAGGHYTFTKVPAGGYMLNAQAPAGYVNTTQLPKNVVVEPAGNSVNILGFQKPGALHVSKAAQSSQASNQLGPDRLITYTLTVTNTGGGLLNDVLVTDTLPAHLQYVNGSASLAPVSVIPLVWQVNSMMPGESVSVRFVTRVADNFNDLVLNTAIAGSRQTLSVQSNEVVIMPAPTAISIVRFTARRGQDGVTVAWITGFERDTFGFNVFRSATGNRADAIQVNTSLIPAGAKGGQYAFVDKGADAGVTYTYWLQEIEISGAVIDYLEAAVTMPMSDQAAIGYRVFMPVLMR
jgi:uncharacterized repeat protein (TIGR01451 family)